MADPLIQTFCCIRNINDSDSVPLNGLDNEVSHFHSVPYHALCITFSTIGILGATYQILPRRGGYSLLSQRHRYTSLIRRRHISMWLATSDLLACTAVLIRSAVWMVQHNHFTSNNDALSEPSFSNLFCAVSSAWIQYFYLSTFFWTFCYAIDMYKIVSQIPVTSKTYGVVSWGIPAILAATGSGIMYTPDLRCTPIFLNPFMRVLPSYIFMYAPVLTVMLINPILYWITSEKAEDAITSFTGRFTTAERKQLRNLRCKFFSINAVFYVCWIPNILGIFLLWVLPSAVPQFVFLINFYLMAILNPLQACFNALVYRRWGDVNNSGTIIFPFSSWCNKDRGSPSASVPSHNETTPNEETYLLESSSKESRPSSSLSVLSDSCWRSNNYYN